MLYYFLLLYSYKLKYYYCFTINPRLLSLTAGGVSPAGSHNTSNGTRGETSTPKKNTAKLYRVYNFATHALICIYEFQNPKTSLTI